MSFDSIFSAIKRDPQNQRFTGQGYEPLYTANAAAKICIVGQAPGLKAQESMIPWNDASGKALREWLGVTNEQFYDPELFSLLPMDFYYPGKGKTGDLPPRPDFAPTWHPQLLALMPELQLTILIGKYARDYYLPQEKPANLTSTVQQRSEFTPKYFPIVHPSPLNFRWQAKNPWFISDILPELKAQVQIALGVT